MRWLATSAGTVSDWSNLKVTVFCFMASSWYSTTEPWTLSTDSRGPRSTVRLRLLIMRRRFSLAAAAALAAASDSAADDSPHESVAFTSL